MKPGVYDIPEAEYFAGPELSASGAKLLLKSPAHYQQSKTAHATPTRAMVVGSALHTTVLGAGEPFVVIDGDGRTKEVKEAKAAAEAAGQAVLNGTEAALVERMADAVYSHRLAAAILSEGKAEQSIYWTDEATGVNCRARLDWWRPNAVADLKSTIDASPTGFGKQAANLHYDVSQAVYQQAVHATTGEWLPFYFIAVEKDEPHAVAVHELPPEAAERGQRLWTQALDLFAQCTETDTWPAYDDGDTPITTEWPRWAA